MKFINMVGRKFDRLVVLGLGHHKTRKRTHWICRCSCGNKTLSEGSALRDGRIKSCGCLQKQNRDQTTHGMSKKSAEYRIWCHVLSRCENKNVPSFYLYGGRGIVVCKRWHSFINFLKDMGLRPTKKHSIDRIKTNGNYTPQNCRWATMKEQQRNRRNNRFVLYKGKLKQLSSLCEELNLNYKAVHHQLTIGKTIYDIIKMLSEDNESYIQSIRRATNDAHKEVKNREIKHA